MITRFSKAQIRSYVQKGFALYGADKKEAMIEMKIAHQGQIAKKAWPALNGRALLVAARCFNTPQHICNLICDSRTDYAKFFSLACQTAWDRKNSTNVLILVACGANPCIPDPLPRNLIFKTQIKLCGLQTDLLEFLLALPTFLPVLLQVELLLSAGQPFINLFQFGFLWNVLASMQTKKRFYLEH